MPVCWRSHHRWEARGLLGSTAAQREPHKASMCSTINYSKLLKLKTLLWSYETTPSGWYDGVRDPNGSWKSLSRTEEAQCPLAFGRCSQFHPLASFTTRFLKSQSLQAKLAKLKKFKNQNVSVRKASCLADHFDSWSALLINNLKEARCAISTWSSDGSKWRKLASQARWTF